MKDEKVKEVTVEITADRHEHEGVEILKGSKIALNPRRAKWMEKNGRGKIVPDGGSK